MAKQKTKARQKEKEREAIRRVNPAIPEVERATIREY